MSEQDPYIWLEDLGNEKTREFYEKEDARAREIVREYSEKLFKRMLDLYTEPVAYNFKASSRGYFYIYREKTFSVKILFRDGFSDTIIDSSSLGSDILIPNYFVSRDGELVAVNISRAGSDEGKLLVIETSTKKIIDEITGSISDVIFLGRDRIYYSKMFRREKCFDGTPPPCERIFIRESGRDEEVFGRGLGPGYFISITQSKTTNKLLGLVSEGWSRSWILTGDLENPSGWSMIHGGEVLNIPIEYLSDREILFIKYDGDGMGRVVALNQVDGSLREFIGESYEQLSSAFILRDRVGVVYTSRNCSSYIKFFDRRGSLIRELFFEKPVTIQGVSVEEDLSGAVIETTSFTQRTNVFRYDSSNNSLEKIYSSRETENIVVEDRWASSFDGTRIHYFLIRRRDNYTRKALVYGYGGFGISLTPMYFPWAIPFVEDGGVFVVANLRGGSEYGEKWHRAGMRENKINVFRDFIAVLEDLRREGFENIAMGGSNGGLLVAATMIMRPDLLRAAVIGYPVLDMLRYHLLYIGRAWVSEYGDPDNPSDRKYLLEYSPYHNLRREARYPPTYIYTGLHDDRVHPAHAFKFHAKLLEYGNESYLRVERAAGHLGASPETQAKQMSDVMGFVYKIHGLSIEKK